MADSPRPSAQSKDEMLSTLNYLREQYQNQYFEVGQALNAALETLTDLNNTRTTLERADFVSNKESLMPLGRYAYVNAKLAKVDSLIVNVGANYFLEYNIDEAKGFISKLLDGQTKFINQLMKSKGELENALIDVTARLDKLTE
ncbi:prefoldin subunit alpha [Candidatus Marsarchaeota archaeon]|jgi:prefoldin alpha subunit|nr:prefoldin subunit alpha [Candidatus Marsarchaeota archaeon]MCL5092563.1 prefoldin subunit alpha [Candidatus Marsarchaeota archaeon]